MPVCLAPEPALGSRKEPWRLLAVSGLIEPTPPGLGQGGPGVRLGGTGWGIRNEDPPRSPKDSRAGPRAARQHRHIPGHRAGGRGRFGPAPTLDRRLLHVHCPPAAARPGHRPNKPRASLLFPSAEVERGRARGASGFLRPRRPAWDRPGLAGSVPCVPGLGAGGISRDRPSASRFLRFFFFSVVNDS